MTKKNKAVALLSGGLDSVVATKLAQGSSYVISAITFDYGQRAFPRESEVAKRVCRELSIEFRSIELPWLRDWTDTALVERDESLPQVSAEGLEEGSLDRANQVWVPNRNGAFVAVAAAFAESAGANSIVMGLNLEEATSFPDNSEDFLKATNVALSFSTRNRVRLTSPTLRMTKREIAEKFMDLDIDPALFWCCYEGGKKLCGRCESCARTIRAFKAAGKWDLISNRFEPKG